MKLLAAACFCLFVCLFVFYCCFKILSTRKLKHGNVCEGILMTLFQKYKLELATSVQVIFLRKYHFISRHFFDNKDAENFA